MSTAKRVVAQLARPQRSSAATTSWAQRPRRSFAQQVAAIKNFPVDGAPLLDSSSKVEEENWDWYSPDVFYPVNIGELFPPRYQVLGKLGFGTRSTVWLCRDLRFVLPENRNSKKTN
jgi:hypothetical protein